MTKLLEIKFTGWTATPRLPFVLSGNALCMHTPSYSTILGIIGCCMGRLVSHNEVKLGFNYMYDTVAIDLETRQRLEYDGRKIRSHSKGTDAYSREFHTSPQLTIWLNRLDWKSHFDCPIGTPSLGRSQDILQVLDVKIIEATSIKKGKLSGCMLPFKDGLKAGGQLVQIAESYTENHIIGSGRIPTKSTIFLSIPHDNSMDIAFENLFHSTLSNQDFYLHEFSDGN